MPPRAAPTGARQGQGQEEGGGIGTIIQNIIRAIAIWWLIQFVIGPNSPIPFFKKTTPVGNVPTPAPSQKAASQPGVVGAPQTTGYEVISLWPVGTTVDLYVYLTTAPSPNSPIYEPIRFSRGPESSDDDLPYTAFRGIKYGEWKGEEAWETTFKVPVSLQSNSSLFADIFLTREGVSPDPRHPSFKIGDVVRIRKLLTKYLPQRKERKQKSLIKGRKEEANDEEEKEVEEPTGPTPIVGYYHPNVSLALVTPSSPINYATLPPVTKQHVYLDPTASKDPTGKYGYHYPIVFANDFWLLNQHMNPINETVTELPIRISLAPMKFFMFQVYSVMEEAFAKQQEMGTGGELDEVKRMLIETNPILLIATFVVSILHSLFEFLAFKNDIGHWRNKKEMVGVSVRTIITNVVVQLIILLYLVDNNENTSWMILGSQGIGVVIEAWKITKAVDIKVIPTPPGSAGVLGMLPYTLDVKDKHVLSEDEKKTQEYDQLAFRWVSYGTIPLLGGYTIYSLIYETHRGWYSFVISTLTSFVYMFGFVQLIPQLIINWKLKSVAHMPMKTLTYKFLTTIVDDFFSFVIKMPLLHRLACFRDDVVFVILLYQYWIYKVDYKRANEYGQVGTDALPEQEKIAEVEPVGSSSAVAAGGQGKKTLSGEENVSAGTIAQEGKKDRW